jgi:hypothetical protein
MHAFIAGPLTDARIADIEREIARDVQRAELRVARSIARPPRRDHFVAAVRRLIGIAVAADEGHLVALPTTSVGSPRG